jgi:hypothetical protein
MHPRQQLQEISAKLMHDVAPAKPDSSAPTSKMDLISAEIEHGIPVKQPKESDHGRSAASNPISSAKQFTQDNDDKADADLDNILKDVNQGIKASAKSTDSKKENKLKKKLLAKQQIQKQGPKANKPILVTVAALVMAGVLVVAAFYAFKQATTATSGKQTQNSSGKVGTAASSSSAIMAAGGTLVKPADLSDLSSTLSSDLNQFDNAQDFNSKDLSDQSLGL